MKITICGSMVFAKEMLEIQKQLENQGHEVQVPITTIQCTTQDGLNEDLAFCIANDVMQDHFNKISDSDAILVLNYPKNNITGYIGGSALMEIAVAKHLKKKIYVLNELPDEKEIRYSLEVKVTQPIIIYGDLNKIN
jgi:hypothetical protein